MNLVCKIGSLKQHLNTYSSLNLLYRFEHPEKHIVEATKQFETLFERPDFLKEVYTTPQVYSVRISASATNIWTLSVSIQSLRL